MATYSGPLEEKGERVVDEEVDGELEVFCRLIYNEMDMAAKIHSNLIVRTQGGKR